MTQENIQTAISGEGDANERGDLFRVEDIAPFWLTALIDSADDAIISKTLEGIIASWNKGAERIFGYTAEEVIGKPILILIPPAYQHEEPHILGRIRAGERIEHYETLRLRKDGTTVHVSLTVSPIKNDAGQIIGVSKIARDITAIKEAEEKLRKSENQLRLITDAIPALISYVDSDLRYRFVNRGYLDWFKLPPEEIIGKHIREIIGQDAYAVILPNMEKVFAGESFDFEQLVSYPSGEKIIHVNYIPDFDPETGKVKGFCALLQDVTESKQAEARLRESENKFARAFDASPLVLTISSLKTGKLIEVNETFVSVTGFSRAEAIGKTTIDLGLWAKPTERDEELETVRQTGSVRSAEYIFHTRNGDIYGLLSAEVVEIGGEPFALTVIQDITKRRRAEERVRESEENLRYTVELNPQVTWTADIEGGIASFSDKWLQMTGLNREEALGDGWMQVPHPEDAPKMQIAWMHSIKTGEPYDIEHRIRLADGVFRWMRSRAFPRRSETGEIIRWYGTTEDIHERKLAEERLRQSGERLQMAMDAARIFSWELNVATGKIEWSSNVERVLGFALPADYKTTVNDLFHAEDREITARKIQRAIENRETFEAEFRLVDPSTGAIVWVRAQGVLADDLADDKQPRFVGITQNINERKQVEFALIEREQLARFNARINAALVKNNSLPEILHTCAESIVQSLDAAFARVWTLDQTNNVLELQASAGMYTHLDGEHARIPFGEYKIGQIAAERRPHLTNSVIGDERVSNQEWAIRENIVAFAGYPLIVEEKLVGVVAMFSRKSLSDVALETLASVASMIALGIERKDSEAEREELLRREQHARQQAEEASRLKDEFLATVSHEIRTPLNAILGWSQLLITNKIGQKDMPGAIQTIYRNAKSQAQLIEDILDVSRIITGKIRLEAQPISLAPVIQTAVESLRPAIEAKNISLRMHLDFEPRPVNADPNRLQQIVWNLLSNAIKFTPENGNVEIRLESDRTQTKIIVSDTGKGINAAFLPFVFERFRQADGSSTRKHGGLGLGLAIVRHIVELHGGEIDVSSEGEDKGTIFTVYLPQAEFAAGHAKRSASEDPAAGEADSAEAQTNASDGMIEGLRVLVLDDEPDTLELLSVILTQSGAKVRTVTAVARALEIIEEWPPDAIVSDIAMPEEDGYSFIKKLRALPPAQGGAIPAIALTAYVGIKERTQVLSSGFQMYVPKPVEPAELVGALASLVQATPTSE